MNQRHRFENDKHTDNNESRDKSDVKKVCTVRREGALGQNLSNSGIPERGKGKSTCQEVEKKSNQKAITQSGNQWCWRSLKLSAVDSIFQGH